LKKRATKHLKKVQLNIRKKGN